MTKTSADIDIISDENAYQGYFCIRQLNIRYRLFNGGWSQPVVREVFERKPSVAVLLYDPALRNIVLIEQFRAGTISNKEHPWLLEVVAGIIDTDETADAVALREAKEETGLVVSELLPVYGYWPSPGASNEYVSFFCGRIDSNDAGGVHGLVEEGEDIRTHVLATETAYQLLAAGKINNAFTIIALQWLQLNEDTLRQQWLAS